METDVDRCETIHKSNGNIPAAAMTVYGTAMTVYGTVYVCMYCVAEYVPSARKVLV